MKKIICLLICLLLLPSLANANPSVDAEAGRDLENSQSQTQDRTKTLDAEKARGHRNAHQDSREHAREKSISKSRRSVVSSSKERHRSTSQEININSYLIRGFVEHYELAQPGHFEGGIGRFFSSCKPITGLEQKYPTYMLDFVEVEPFAAGGGQLKPGYFRPREYGESNFYAQGAYALFENSGINLRKQGFKVIEGYGECRIAASRWVAIAANTLADKEFSSIDDLRTAIDKIYSEMDANQDLIKEIVDYATNTWDNAFCNLTIKSYIDFDGVNFNCGTVVIKGSEIEVNGQVTLAENSIEGQNYTASISSSTSESNQEEASRSRDSSESVSQRESDSRERYAERRRSASMSKSSREESSNNFSVSRGSSAGLNASPKD